MKTVYVIFSLLILSCGTSKKAVDTYVNSKNKIIGIQEFNSAFVLKSINESTLDTTYILSAKRDYLKKQKLTESFKDGEGEAIITNEIYSFELLSMRLRASNMETLGVYLVFDNDTIWSGANYNERKYFLSKKSIDLYIKEK